VLAKMGISFAGRSLTLSLAPLLGAESIRATAARFGNRVLNFMRAAPNCPHHDCRPAMFSSVIEVNG
jgi:hypothetical protein